MSDFDEFQEPGELDGQHEHSDQHPAEAGSQTTRPDAGREKARRSLEEELTPEFSRPIPSAVPASIPSPELLAIASRPEDTAGTWDNYSRYELWQMYAKANDAALSRGAEIDSLNRQLAGQEEVSKDSLKKTCDDFARQLAEQETKFNTRLAGQAQQLQNHSESQRRTMQGEHQAALALFQEQANDKIEVAQQQAAHACAGQKYTRTVWMRVSAGLAAAVLFLGVVVYLQRTRYIDALQAREQARAIAVQVQGDLTQARAQLNFLQNGGVSAARTVQTAAAAPAAEMFQPQQTVKQQYAAASAMLRKMHVQLPPRYEEMREFQQYSDALIRFNAALATVPVAHRDNVIFATAEDQKKIKHPTICAAEFVENVGTIRALFVDPDQWDNTRTNLQAEAQRLEACTPAVRQRVYFEFSHPQVNWDEVRADQQRAQERVAQVSDK